MYAIIEDSGTQIKMTPGDVLDLDVRDLADESGTVSFDRVLLLGHDDDSDDAAVVGRPYVEGATVTAEVMGEVSGDKIDVFQFKRRKGHRRKIGHRQRYLRVRVKEISDLGG